TAKGSLAGFHDWASLQMKFTNVADYGLGVHLTTAAVDEPSKASIIAKSPDSDGGGIKNSLDNCPTVANANQADADGDGVGDACKVIPTVTCVDFVSGSTYRAHFGYTNPSLSVAFPVGALNSVSPAPADRGQPTNFQSGVVADAFTADF